MVDTMTTREAQRTEFQLAGGANCGKGGLALDRLALYGPKGWRMLVGEGKVNLE